MKRIAAVLVLILSLGVSPGLHAHEEAKDINAMSQYVVGLIYKGDAWKPGDAEGIQELQMAHLANIGRLAEEGLLALAGPFADDGDLRGLFFFNVKTVEEAQKLVDSDPAVMAGQLRVELHPWWGTALLATFYNDAVERAKQEP
ncbi:MAG: hypothetical protein HKN21_11980 [Candidatus Eisenbacteria bacterium]|uniref:YCII-related domain-containing protein n=1 Tax=Eiseniibacteriota bacterium TaxID=2212470 RepID=A0A7Y2ECI4_UNCEI|nr:hypothetical protein [Candidatus Eisenbacteria bacterium]